MHDASDGVRGDEEQEESVECEPGQEVAATPAVEAAQGEQVHHRGEGREHGDRQTCMMKMMIDD